METVTEVSVSKLESSRYMKPLRLHYTQNGIAKMWDLGMSAPSVAVVIYNKSRKTLVLVKQLRPAVLFAEILNDSYANADDLEKLNQLLTGNFFSFLSNSITKMSFQIFQRILEKEASPQSCVQASLTKTRPWQKLLLRRSLRSVATNCQNP